MARLNIEEDAWARIDLVASRLKWSKREVIGTLVLLWRGTQTLQMTTVTLEEISRLTGIRSQVKLKSFVSLLADDLHWFVSRVEVDLYFIKGNDKQISALNSYKERGKKGGRPKREKATGFGSQNPIQYNTIQYKYPLPPTGNSPCRSAEFLKIWNDNRGALPKVQTLTSKRRAQIKTRLAENADLDYWANVVRRMAASAFCVEGKWATFDWLIKNDTNHAKVTEGNYDNSESGGKSKASEGCSCKMGRYKIREKTYRCPHCEYGRFLKMDDWPFITPQLLEEYKSLETID